MIPNLEEEIKKYNIANLKYEFQHDKKYSWLDRKSLNIL